MWYVKKPIPVEAFCPAEDVAPPWFTQHPFKMILSNDDGPNQIIISTIEGDMTCYETDYIIRGVDGELYPCRRDIFLKTYDKIEKDN